MAPRKANQTATASAENTTILEPTRDQQAHTPEQSPSKRAVGITQAQKQALINNLQLEITERARKLRAQYASQAQALRSRLELRINRIPQALRKRKMQDLLDEYAERANPKPAPAIAVHHEQTPQEDEPARKSLKRQSDHISAAEHDKENVPTSSQATQPDLANPKKRAKTATTTATANTKAARTVSRKAVPSTVLSPKSHNSRTLPRSPIKGAGYSSDKPISRPASPIKPSITAVPAAGKRTASRAQAKRGPAAVDLDAGRSSEASNTSAGTTIVSKPAPKGRAAAAAKKTVAAAKPTAAAAKRGAAAKKENVPPASTAAAGRSLRKRA